MEKQLSATVKLYLTVLAGLAWFALGGQFYINVNSKMASVPELIVRYFSYFTILTNLLIALCCTTLLLGAPPKQGSFFARQQTLAALTVYTVIVGLIYNTILRFIWVPEGLQRVVDEILHSIIPVLFLFFWLLFASKNQLQWKNIWSWLLFPFAYILYSLIRGAVYGFYPYPFINSRQLGINKVLVNSVGIAAVFICFSLIAVAIGKSSTKKKS